MVYGVSGVRRKVCFGSSAEMLRRGNAGAAKPMSPAELERCQRMGITQIDKLLSMEDLVCGEEVMCAVTGITDGDAGRCTIKGNEVRTNSL